MRFRDRIVARLTLRCLGIWAMSLPLQTLADVTITQLANEGVLLDDGRSTRVMIDGMVVESYSVYAGLPETLHPSFYQATDSFAGIDLALVSHQHHDHNQPIHACRFMQASRATVLYSSTQVMDLMREKCREFTLTSPRIKLINPEYDRPEVLQVKDARVSAFLLSHGRGKYAILQNFGHLVEIGGMRVLHIGDAAMNATDFARAGVAEMGVDIALVPFWYFQPGPGGDIVRRFLDAPNTIAVHIPPSELHEVKEHLRVEYPEVIVLDDVFDQARFNATTPSSP